MRNFAAVLLAGGRSARMGMNKAWLECAGQPLWRFQIEKLAQLKPGRLFFSVPRDSGFPGGCWTFVHDRSEQSGPLGGLEAALRLTCEEFLVTLAVDMPGLTSAFLRSLLEKAGPPGVVPFLDGFYHGAAAIYPTGILPLVERLLANHDRSFQHLIREALKAGIMRVHEVAPVERDLFENWNSKEDLEGNRVRY